MVERKLIYWLNSLGPSVSPRGLVVDSAEDLVDGVALCQVARRALLDAAAQRTHLLADLQLLQVELNQIEPLRSDRSAENLSVAAHIASALSRVSLPGPSMPPTSTFVLTVLGIFHNLFKKRTSKDGKHGPASNIDRNKTSIEGVADGNRTDRKSSLTTKQDTNLNSVKPKNASTVRGRRTERFAGRNRQGRSPTRRARIASKERIEEKPAWNASVTLSDTTTSDHPSGRKRRHKEYQHAKGFRRGSLVDPTFRPTNRMQDQQERTIEPLLSKKSSLSRRLRSSSIGSLPVTRTAPATRARGRLDTVPNILKRLITSDNRETESLQVDYRRTLRWLTQPGVLLHVFKRYCSFGTRLWEEVEPSDVLNDVANIVSDGVFLCEIARFLQETYLTAAINDLHPCIERRVTRPDGKVRKYLLLQGMTTEPKTHGAKVKNVSIALEVLKKFTKLSPRHLFSAERIVSRNPPAACWELLHDIQVTFGNIELQKTRETSSSTKERAAHSSSRNAASLLVTRQRSSSLDERRLTRSRSSISQQGNQRDTTHHEDIDDSKTYQFAASPAPMRRSRSFSSSSSRSLLGHQQNLVAPVSSIPLQGTRPHVPIHVQLGHADLEKKFIQLSSPEPDPPRGLITFSPEQERELAVWVRAFTEKASLPLGDLNYEASTPLLEDKTRNGLALRTIFAVVEPDVHALFKSHGYISSASARHSQSVKTIAEATRITSAALQAMYLVLSEKHHRKATKLNSSLEKLLWLLRQDPQDYIRGDARLFWNLLQALRDTYDSQENNPQRIESIGADPESTTARLDRTYHRIGSHTDTATLPPPPPSSSSSSSSGLHSRVLQPRNPLNSPAALLPYSKQQLDALDNGLAQWLADLGVIANYISGKAFDVVSLLDCEPLRLALMHGLLLADVVSVALQSGVRITGLFRPPKTDALAKKNIDKVLGVLRSRQDIGRRFLFSADEISKGCRVSILGLLEDIMRASFGEPPRPVVVNPLEKPFLPHTSGVSLPVSKGNHLNRTGDREKESDQENSPSLSIRCNQSADIWPSPFTARDLANFTTRARPLTPKRKVKNKPSASASSILAPRGQSDSNFPGIVPIPRRSRARSVSHSPERSSRASVRSLSQQSRKNSLSPEPRETAFDATMDAYSQREFANVNVDSLLEFLVDIHRLPLREPEKLYDYNATCQEFNDGVLLALLVEKVEHIRGGLQGIEPRPKTTAACLHNIRSALAVLQQNKRMPPRLLWSERDIAAGKASVIVPLLAQIQKTYTP